ncbi:SWIM zinc finger family protein [Streptosporangium roseum]|uniref:Zinc finger SWIM domain protein n=1 Tax=Streptosporangium roseum (strain ATCC 12428 / DSM 43021 / JCM 3005 / KCTC 9067 / NCIMB 10171 / NRRL 2505 / NI 9100) TaxID=479432 RepID=D2B1W5_STRRD|nr:SWIM zinc finger family protein [Streptosporangium roseum]ACZ89189.1 zinc finger SWIM domain protein [Streptosporangium roseum DSM 43021]
MIERWNRDQVLALAPDASSQKAAQGVSSPGKWSGAGVTADALWGECKGSGSKPYRACVDLSEPAYRCSCPSRKFPCKHALGLLLLWSADGVPAAAEPADWVAEWLDQRRDRAARAVARPAAAAGTAGAAETGPSGDPRRAEQREQRVAAGLSELERWLADQIRQGIAGSRRHDQWDDLARRLIDAQAPGVAGSVSRLNAVLATDDWPARLLGEYALLHLLSVAHRRLPEVVRAAEAGADAGPETGEPRSPAAGLLRRVRERVGFPVTREEVLAGETVRDVWDVLGRRDEEQDRLTARRVWLRGRDTGRAALVLSFAPPGQALDASLVTGTAIDADLAFYPGSSPLRALVAARHDGVPAGPPPGSTLEQALEEVAEALAGDPWLDSWPVVVTSVTPAGSPSWQLAGSSGGLVLHPSAGTPWRLIAASGGHPLTVAAEWTPRGLRPLTTWDEEGRVIVL